MRIAQGDRHNFGQRVEKQMIHGQAWMIKPRSVFWEWLFLDRESSFRRSLRSLSPFGWDKVLGHIETIGHDGLARGRSHYIRSESIELDHEWFRNFGRLAAFAATFGWGDLHFENLVPRAQGFQVVDLECVFGDVQLSGESCLIPSPRTAAASEWKFTGLGGLIERQNLSAGELREVLRGLRDGLFNLHELSEPLTDIFAELKPLLATKHKRIILRETSVYNSILKGAAIPPDLLPEERVQLARGDVPFFINFPGQRQVCYMSSPEVWTEVQGLGEAQMATVIRSDLAPEKALAKTRLRRLEKILCAEWAARFFPQSEVEIVDRDLQIQRRPSHLLLQTPDWKVRVPTTAS